MSADAGIEAGIDTPPAGASGTVARWERLFFAAVGLSALWIGFWGYFLPAISSKRGVARSENPSPARSMNRAARFSFVVTSGVGSGGSITLGDSESLADGSYTYTVRQTDLAGNVSLSSDGLAVTIDTTAPDAPSIALEFDSGIVGDHVIRDRRPMFQISGCEIGWPPKRPLWLNGFRSSAFYMSGKR